MHAFQHICEIPWKIARMLLGPAEHVTSSSFMLQLFWNARIMKTLSGICAMYVAVYIVYTVTPLSEGGQEE
jgi:hypothetical protein